jgi:hypothetical protein
LASPERQNESLSCCRLDKTPKLGVHQTGSSSVDAAKLTVSYELIISPLLSVKEETITYRTNKADADQAKIDFDPAGQSFQLPVTGKVDQGSGDDWIVTTKGRLFATKGHSGAAIVDSNGNIVRNRRHSRLRRDQCFR